VNLPRVQATHDGVDVVSISLGSINSASGVPCLNSFDVALLFAVSTGVVVVHAAGNSGPYPSTMNSYGPWVVSVGASLSDRAYENHVTTRTNQDYLGTGFSGNQYYAAQMLRYIMICKCAESSSESSDTQQNAVVDASNLTYLVMFLLHLSCSWNSTAFLVLPDLCGRCIEQRY
jgi:subtilisin family serine protease